MTQGMLGFISFWGIWLLVPLLVDGVTALSYMATGLWLARQRAKAPAGGAPETLPKVSVVIPVYNGAGIIGRCLQALRDQEYPQENLEILIVDNLSTDGTADQVRQQQQLPFGGALKYLSVPFNGKSWALNAGIYRTTGEIICNVDADVQLHPQAIRAVALAFAADPKLAAVTGVLEVSEIPFREKASALQRIIAKCEHLEYVASFRIGRQYQSMTNSLFTLAGAFTGYRREVLLQTSLYQSQTVSEDTHLTFDIYRKFKKMRLACLSNAVAVVEPTPSLSALYAQRVRWQRGELEVASLFQEFLGMPTVLRGLSLSRSLLVDHTLAFPRMVWVFLLLPFTSWVIPWGWWWPRPWGCTPCTPPWTASTCWWRGRCPTAPPGPGCGAVGGCLG